jgi:acetyl-CoA acetyltransferase
MGKEVRVAFPSRQAAIVGVYITAQGRNMGRSMVDLELEALKGALDDAGLSFKDIDGLATNTYHSPVGGSDDPRLYWAEQLGQQNLGVMEAGMASGALAKMAVCISAGMCDTAVMLAGGFDPPPTIDTASGGKVNPAQVALPDTAPYVGEWDYSIHGGARAAFYAAWARRYMHEFGATEEHLANVAVTMRRNATLTKSSVMGSRGKITVEDVLNSRMIASPLHMLDCCLVNEGGWAIVMTTAERARDLKKQPVYVLGGAEFAYLDRYLNIPNPWMPAEGAGMRKCVDRTFAMAGVSRDDIDVAGLYDCFTITLLRDLEEAGFCGVGEAGEFVAEGNIALEGRLPVNTNGGLLSHSHNGRPDGYHTIDVVQQLRGEVEPERQIKDAKIGLSISQGYSSHGAGGAMIMAVD